jgi:hypothetical protein
MPVKVCGDCKWFKQHDGGGHCYFHPPMPCTKGHTARPWVDREEMACSEFKKK